MLCVPFSPWWDSCLPAGTAPPATWHQSLLCTHMTKVKTSRNLLLFTKTKPKKVSKGQTTPNHSSSCCLPQCTVSPITEHTVLAFRVSHIPTATELPLSNCSAQGGWKNRPCCLPLPPGNLSLLLQKELLHGGFMLDFSYFSSCFSFPVDADLHNKQVTGTQEMFFKAEEESQAAPPPRRLLRTKCCFPGMLLHSLLHGPLSKTSRSCWDPTGDRSDPEQNIRLVKLHGGLRGASGTQTFLT